MLRFAKGGCDFRHELVHGVVALAAPLRLAPKYPAAPASRAMLETNEIAVGGVLVVDIITVLFLTTPIGSIDDTLW